MSILKYRDRKDPLLTEDPFELFQLETFEPPRVDPVFHRTRRGPNSKLTFGVLCAAIAAIGVFAYLRMDDKNASDKPFAYFEVRALDTAGRPLAGVLVRNGGRKIGVTDSFGEWRRFMKVTPGSTVALELSKKTSEGQVIAAKNFAVPARMPREGELVIKGSVQLSKASAGAEVAADPASEVTSRQAASNPSRNLTPAEIVASSAEAVPAEKSVATAPEPPATKNSVSLSSPYDSVWFKHDDGADAPSAQAVVASLRQRAAELGIQVDPQAKWQVSIHHLITREPSIHGAAATGLLMVTSDVAQSGDRAAFLRNYEALPMTTARGILYVLSLHIPKDYVVAQGPTGWFVQESNRSKGIWSLAPGKNFENVAGRMFFATGETIILDSGVRGFALAPKEVRPCESTLTSCLVFNPGLTKQPPLQSWQRQTLRLATAGQPDERVFVSGYQAMPRGAGVWEYWGHSGAAANVTVVAQGRVVYRGKTTGNAGTGKVSFRAPQQNSLRR